MQPLPRCTGSSERSLNRLRVGGGPLGGRTIALMGLDGTGKSTQARFLEETLQERGDRVVVIHHASTKVPGLAQAKRRFHGRVVAALKKRGAHSDWKNRAPISKRGRLLSAPLSWWLLWGSLFKSWWYYSRYRGVTTILDRCFLDDVVKVRWRLNQGWTLARALLRVVPRPNLVIVLEGDPMVTFQRKKEANCSYPEYVAKAGMLDQVLDEARRHGWVVEKVEIAARTPEEVGRMVSQLAARTTSYRA
jgi:thymidylate kinase